MKKAYIRPEIDFEPIEAESFMKSSKGYGEDTWNPGETGSGGSFGQDGDGDAKRFGGFIFDIDE